LRDLDSINPQMARPASLITTAAIVPIGFSLIGATLGCSAAPSVPFTSNPICLFNIFIFGTTIWMICLSKWNNWGWNVKYFGASLLHLASVTLIFLVPCFCLLIYSTASLVLRCFIFFSCMAVHVIWCLRFQEIYRKIYDNINTVNTLYQEENDAIYYIQKYDKYLLDKKHTFKQFPDNWSFLSSILLSLSLVAFVEPLKNTLGLPFIHIFFLMTTLPISLMAAGLATRSWLIFYYYPMKIRKRTSKQVYVDMVTGSNSFK
jgi:hypothetical protein